MSQALPFGAACYRLRGTRARGPKGQSWPCWRGHVELAVLGQNQKPSVAERSRAKAIMDPYRPDPPPRNSENPRSGTPLIGPSSARQELPDVDHLRRRRSLSFQTVRPSRPTSNAASIRPTKPRNHLPFRFASGVDSAPKRRNRFFKNTPPTFSNYPSPRRHDAGPCFSDRRAGLPG
jgi:hypothetical protein